MLFDKKSGGIVYDLMIHDIDFLLSVAGMPDWVYARTRKAGTEHTSYVNALLGYPGFDVCLEGGFNLPHSYPFTFGFRLTTWDMAVEYTNINDIGLVKKYTNDSCSENSVAGDDLRYQREIEYFINCINENIQPRIGNVRSSAEAVRLARAIEMSAERNERIAITKNGDAK